ncbi:unnamed protein product [Lymnaea stagnalis]|uniref:K Homology domain-containing protein n=1 Tax=Lymnaea stagnalis TaxID=6523 RepID=A0AAV2HE12_LYMST
MLPNSTERAVTVSGTADAITQCIKYVCGIMLESPPKGANLPYRPKPLLSPVYISSSQGFTVPASLPSLPGQEVCMPRLTYSWNQPIPSEGPFPGHMLPKGFPHPVQMAHAIPMVTSGQTVVPGSLVPVNERHQTFYDDSWLGNTYYHVPTWSNRFQKEDQCLGPAALPHMWPGPLPPPPQPPPPCLIMVPNHLKSTDQWGLGPSLQYTQRPGNPGPPSALPSLTQQAQEMNIPNDLIGCIIGRGGQKINEIRQVSGANIKISNAEDGSSDRKVTITGSPECIGLAQYLISTSMELHKTLTLDPASLPPVSSVAGPLPQMSPHPMAMTVVKPLPPPGMLGLNGMAGLNGMGQLVDPASMGAQGPPSSIAIACSLSAPSAMAGGKPLQTKMRVGLTATSAFKAAERPKFSPY